MENIIQPAVFIYIILGIFWPLGKTLIRDRGKTQSGGGNEAYYKMDNHPVGIRPYSTIQVAKIMRLACAHGSTSAHANSE